MSVRLRPSVYRILCRPTSEGETYHNWSTLVIVTGNSTSPDVTQTYGMYLFWRSLSKQITKTVHTQNNGDSIHICPPWLKYHSLRVGAYLYIVTLPPMKIISAEAWAEVDIIRFRWVTTYLLHRHISLEIHFSINVFVVVLKTVVWLAIWQHP